MTQSNLGTAYTDLPAEDRGKNLHKAIACYEAASRGYNAVGMREDAKDARRRAEVWRGEL